MFTLAFARKGRRVSYYAPTRDDAREITWTELITRCEPVIIKMNETLLQITIRTVDEGKSTITLYGWEALKERGKGRGLANDFIVLDEVPTYKDFWVGWDEVLSPTLIDRRGSAMFIGTPQGYNHFYDLSLREATDPDFKSFHFTTYDNPHIPVDEIEREKRAKPDTVFSQEYLALFTKRQGLVYPDFDRKKHIFDDETPYNKIERIAGVDFGFRNPAVVLSIDVDDRGIYWIREEWYKTEKLNAEVIEYAGTTNANVFYPDPAEPDRIEEMKRAGLNVREVVKDVQVRIDKVTELLRAGRIRVHESCKNTIMEFETYSWRNDLPGPKDAVLKENDHAMDAMGMALVMHSKNVFTQLEDGDFNMYTTNYT